MYNFFIMVSEEVKIYFNENVKKCGWNNLYYGVFSSLIKEFNAQVTAEVGCGYGQHSKQILQDTNVSKHYMIDQYKFYPNDTFSDGIKNIKSNQTVDEKFNDFSEMVKNEVAQFKERVQFIHKSSIEASHDISDNSLDAVFVDANHEFKYVLEDLYAWWPKVKSGGFMAGDDYCINDVKHAVNFFSNHKELEVYFRIKENTDYKIYYFIKH